MKIDVIYNKSCQRMTELPDESIDMSMTSPPYWGLRDYGEDVKEIWGGDPDCEHKFNSPLPGHHPGQVPQTKKQVASGSKDSGQFCQKCGAWHGQLGLEPTFQFYLDHMIIVCAEIKRVLKKTGSFWLNMGDTYYSDCTVRKVGKDAFLRKGDSNYDEYLRSSVNAGASKTHRRNFSQRELQSKCLIGIPWRLVLRLINEQGWIQRNAIIWSKPNAMPSSVKDRCSNSYEFLFHLVKAKKYYYDLDAIREPYTEPLNRWGGPKTKVTDKSKGDQFAIQEREGRERRPNVAGKNPGDVWIIPTQPRPEAHFATFPDKLCIKPILATCPAEVCKKCGKARVRITETSYIPSLARPGSNPEICRTRPAQPVPGDKGTSSINKRILDARHQTIGWTDCGCNAGWDGGVLLDPFAGRGTSLIMAKKLGRHYIGYELKKEYCEKLIKPVLEEIDPLFKRRNNANIRSE